MRSIKNILPFLMAESTPVSHGEKIRSAGAALLAILLVAIVSDPFTHDSGLPLMVASMGASAVLLFAIPHSPLVQPWPLIGGHLISVFIGITCAKLIPDLWLSAALAVALSLLAMHLSHSLHPPGGAATLLPVLGNNAVHTDGYGLLLPVALNVLTLFIMALVLNNILPGRHYPARTAKNKDKLHRHGDPPPMQRLGIVQSDLHQALREMGTYLDISEAELGHVYQLAEQHAQRRKMGAIACGDIMSRDVVSVEFGTELEEVWTQLYHHKVKALPVVDNFRRVIGIVTVVDFLKHADLRTHMSLKDKILELIRRTPGHASEKPEVAGQIMSPQVFTAEEGRHIVELVPLLSDKGMHHIPIVDSERRLVGMVTQSDLIAALYRSIVQAPEV
ncbi:MAG: HPP family protein [Betaproteobacteria bacterium]|nr:HPP family protein [Betaproteobacteria bacterium]